MHRFEEAKSEALRAVDIFERLGAVRDLEFCRRHLRRIQHKLDSLAASGQSRINRESLQIGLFNSCILTLHSKLRDPESHQVLDMHPSASFSPHLAPPCTPNIATSSNNVLPYIRLRSCSVYIFCSTARC